MAGYPGTPLAKKVGIKDDFRAALLHVPEEVRIELRRPLAKCQILNLKRKELDFIFFFAHSLAALWISWPKKSSGVATDLTEEAVRQSGLAAGLVDVKVCAVTDIWSGLKFVIPAKNRPKTL